MYINNQNYAEMAEKVIGNLDSKLNPRTQKMEPKLTTSKIRNILSMVSDIYNEVILLQDDKLDETIIGRIEYLRIRIIYEEGRDFLVRDFAEKAKICSILKEINGSRKNYILFSRYMESLIAFHKFYGGKDN